jgi:hypothetical protein
LDAFLLLSIPLLQLPSTLALAFPNENPNLYRSGGALVPAFILAATALHQAMRAIESRVAGRWGKIFAWILALSLLAGAAIQDYQWVFERYRLQYLLSAQNTSDLGRVAADFIHAGGSPDDVYVMGYPYWVDARLVAINAGYPERNFGLFIDGLPALQSAPGAASRARLFMLNPQDEAAHRSLQAAFPQGWFESVRSSIPGKDFDVFFSIPK